MELTHRLKRTAWNTMRVETREGRRVRQYQLATVERLAERAHTGRSLDLIAFSDWRVQSLGTLVDFIAQGPQPHLILYAGDDLARFRPRGRNYFERLAGLSVCGLCAVAGNDDVPESRELIAGRGVYAVHSVPLVLGPFAVVGLEGAPLFRNGGLNLGGLLYPPDFREEHLAKCKRVLPRKRLIIVSHAPPSEVLDFSVRFGPAHIGCPALRQFLESSREAILCVCGHSHRCGGQVAELGGAVVVNAASHDRVGDLGRVARIQIRAGRVVKERVEWHEVA